MMQRKVIFWLILIPVIVFFFFIGVMVFVHFAAPEYTPLTYRAQGKEVRSYSTIGTVDVFVDGKGFGSRFSVSGSDSQALLGPISIGERRVFLKVADKRLFTFCDTHIYTASNVILLTDLSYPSYDLSDDMKGWNVKYRIHESDGVLHYVVEPSGTLSSRIEFSVPVSWFDETKKADGI